MLNNLAKTKLLILDDFGLAPLTVVVSQLPVERWHEMLEHPPSPMRS